MTEIALELDNVASKSFTDLMNHYNVSSRAELISKGIAMLKLAAYVANTQGELIARKGSHETKILVR